MDDYQKLSDEAKQAWRRGFELAHPRTGQPQLSREAQGSRNPDDPPASVARAVDLVGAALEGLGSDEGGSIPAGTSASGLRMVVMDPVSVEAVIVEFDKLSSDECKDALGRGFLRGMIAKAKAASAEDSDSDPPLMN